MKVCPQRLKQTVQTTVRVDLISTKTIDKPVKLRMQSFEYHNPSVDSRECDLDHLSKLGVNHITLQPGQTVNQIIYDGRNMKAFDLELVDSSIPDVQMKLRIRQTQKEPFSYIALFKYLNIANVIVTLVMFYRKVSLSIG